VLALMTFEIALEREQPRVGGLRAEARCDV
jgi:hypothetical protein